MTTKPLQHFDIGGLLTEVYKQAIGLVVSTNNPRGFKRIVYAHMAKTQCPKVHIYQDRTSPNRLILLNRAREEFANA
jgi:hypothetical protein